MDKYAVVIDPKKVTKEKTAGDNQGNAPADNPDVNVPMDPEKGTEPFEKDDNGEA